MHFAVSRQKSYNPASLSRSSKVPLFRRRQTRTIAAVLGTLVLSIFALSRLLSSGGPDSERTPSGTPPVVIITVLDVEKSSDRYLDMILENRKVYAERHGYATFFPNTTSYPLGGNFYPLSWSKIPAMRHAMQLYPYSEWLWYIPPNALIMNNEVALHTDILTPKNLESLMMEDVPIVPPDSAIKTFKHLEGEDIGVVVSQEEKTLCLGSLAVRTGGAGKKGREARDWGRFFLDSWFDPLLRSYNFHKAELHALVSLAMDESHPFFGADIKIRSTSFSGAVRSWPN